MKIAIIITGDVRECPGKHIIKKIFKNYDVFCGSYVRHEEYISTFADLKNCCLINEETDIRLPDGISKNNIQQNMLQWLHLDNVIKNFKDKLINYDVILKYRFDYFIYDHNFLQKISIKPNNIYINTDRIFYADTNTFLKIFTSYYDNLKNYTYHPNRDYKDDSFITSWKSEPAFQQHLKKMKVIINPLQFPIGQLVRGSYSKEIADGNKKLYVNGELRGKFYKKIN